MLQPIIGFYHDEHGDWVAQLACGHSQHLRHNPPWQVRAWVTTPEGRQQHLGYPLHCKACEQGAPRG